MPLVKNDIVTLEIEDFNVTGAGVGKTDGVPVFVSGAVIGDTVRAKITKKKKNYAYARTEEIVRPSADRVQAACPVADTCGSCQLQAYAYDAQLRYKEKKVRDALTRIGGLDAAQTDAVMRPVCGMENPFRYRNKAQYPAGRRETGEAVFGFYAVHSHRVVETEDCLLGPEENRKILRAVAESMRIADIAPYNEEDGTGYVRHVLIRKGFSSGRIMVCLVVNAESALSRFRDVLILQLAEINHIDSVCFNYNTEKTNVILGAETECVYGRPYIEDTLCGLTFRISAQSFYQVNPVITEQLYETVSHFVSGEAESANKKPVVWDLYCGIGTISLMLAKDGAKRVYGIEIVEEAVVDARENARINDIRNADFLCGKAEDESLTKELPKPDVIVVDPPRAGCEETLLKTVLRANPARIVYVSCDPATLARDLKILVAGGYAVREIRPYDMFPHTTHVETVCLMSRVKDRPLKKCLIYGIFGALLVSHDKRK
ncbi:MAG: 23S rRNA (uracil(1939)-C(5))-methyltransferase RlmD [Lachnospiraceae bacterium]|nr:23S rRNA (uracil(1939)-C(5))-methyltransferase RlmD [Lachnospiraceae bacterium]